MTGTRATRPADTELITLMTRLRKFCRLVRILLVTHHSYADIFLVEMSKERAITTNA